MKKKIIYTKSFYINICPVESSSCEPDGYFTLIFFESHFVRVYISIVESSYFHSDNLHLVDMCRFMIIGMLLKPIPKILFFNMP